MHAWLMLYYVIRLKGVCFKATIYLCEAGPHVYQRGKGGRYLSSFWDVHRCRSIILLLEVYLVSSRMQSIVGRE